MPPCPRCSTENVPGTPLCVRCGTPLAQPQQPYAQPQQPYAQPQQPYAQPQQPYAQPQQPYAQPQQPYGQAPQPYQQAAPVAPAIGASGQPAWGAPAAPQQPIGSAPGGAQQGDAGDADPERKLKLGGFPSKFGAAFCYAPICGCLPAIYAVVALLSEDKQNKFVRFHALQAVIVWVALIIFSILAFVLNIISGAVISATSGGIVGTIVWYAVMAFVGVVGLVFTATLIAGVVVSFMGKPYRFPVIGAIAAKKVEL